MIDPVKKIILFIGVVIISCSAYSQTYQELIGKALEYVELDSIDTAERLFRQALKLEPANAHNALVFSNIGMIQQRTGRYGEAIESFTYALNIAPTVVPVLLNRAAVYMEMGAINKAYVDYCQVLDVDKQSTEALLMRAYIYVMKRDYKSARTDYNRLLQIDPLSYSGRLGLATLYQKEEKYKEAIEIINNMLIADSQDATLYMMRAGIENDMKQIDAAFADLGEAIRINPRLPEPYLIRGEIYLEQKKKTLAKQDFEKAISLGIPQSELRDLLMKCK